MSIYIKYVIAWVPMLIIAVLNGTLRDLGYKKYVGDIAAHQISTVTLIFFFSVYIRYIVGQFPPATERVALILGFLWMVLTLGFEFGFGLARGNSLNRLLSDYNILAGRLWSLIPAFIAIAPYLFYKLQSLKPR